MEVYKVEYFHRHWKIWLQVYRDDRLKTPVFFYSLQEAEGYRDIKNMIYKTKYRVRKIKEYKRYM